MRFVLHLHICIRNECDLIWITQKLGERAYTSGNVSDYWCFVLPCLDCGKEI